MAKGKGFLKSKAGKNIMNVIYGLGAAVVIAGALFKIMHWKGANEMLILGMGVEALVFIISAFDMPADDYEWERVYPQLGDSNYIPDPTSYNQPSLDTSSLSTALKGFDANIFGSLNTTMGALKDNMSKFNGVADAANLTNGYSEAIKGATSKLDSLNKSYGVAVESMGKFAGAAEDAKAYQDQVVKVTKSLTSLNGVYELELQNANTHLKSLNQFYGSMTQAMSSMVDASKDAESYKQGMADLNKNLTKLNSVYGNMLAAMSGGAK
ncbi:MAG: gliding motility protein GldL [Bacteroidia bacterium]